jgi:hypothetical protein
LNVELTRYWFVRLALINGIGLFASSLSLAAALAPELPEVEKVGWMGWTGWSFIIFLGIFAASLVT